ncbi:spore coat U domain-containing protein [Pseudomonas sp. 13B_2.1_Bac1]|jgi:spore coat protein U-like protein|uniref:SCPU domain-containing protein n=1 Tax=Pseudomonas aylmerensis TaxID=1869229 RepID=A0A2T4G896_9PSED|nr:MULTISPECIES: spore coat protein U domain-containing protein [Pseudomonas]MBS7842525.1 spore coat protein U domain-containing protein [Pseudomonas fluorescens]MBK5478040.1 spore coat protein U domain-containing protein [Pseudomonas sp. TH21]MCU1784142.1 spore coat U domain-containing protein [Pseudomonas sp. 13B_2.1_Bac1]OCW29475.1 spore coat protein [Pseudomonas aylmerensis]PTC31910.1 SCPU domain-containing protein [Pseudomonas aylmerensis]
MQSLALRLAVPVLGLALAAGAQAATTVTGQISSSLILTSSCLVNGGAGTTNLNFGSLNFGTTTSLFTQTGTQLVAAGGGAVSIQCSSGTTPTVTIQGGLHDGQSTGGTRALYDGVANFVPYDLYTDSGFNNLLAANGVINLAASTGAAQTINLWGKAVGKAGLPAGTYTDTIAVQLSF